MEIYVSLLKPYRLNACGELLTISTTFSYFDPQESSRKVSLTISDGRFRHDALRYQIWFVGVKARNRAPNGALRTVFDLGLSSLIVIHFLTPTKEDLKDLR